VSDTLLVTIIIEGVVGLVYARWCRKPAPSILITSLLMNVVTQSLLWIALNVFFQDYRFTLLLAEGLIWLVEGMFLHVVRSNQLNINEALLLSLLMNGVSFGLGLLLPF
jgi:hypothetical protein